MGFSDEVKGLEREEGVENAIGIDEIVEVVEDGMGLGEVEQMQIGLVGSVVGKGRGTVVIVINDMKLANNLYQRFPLLPNKTHPITSLIIKASHIGESKVLIIIEVVINRKVGVVALGELEDGGGEELAGGEGEEGG